MTENGRPRSEVERAATFDAERVQRRARLRAEAESLRGNPDDVVASQRLRAELEAITSRHVTAFFEAAELTAEVLGADEVAKRWAEPSALAGLSVGGLASHVYAAMRRFEVALDDELPARPATVTLAEYYGANRIESPEDLGSGVAAFLRDDAEQRAHHGATATVTRFREVIERLRDRLPGEPPDRPVTVIQVPDGITPLDDYLATRVVELVVHGDDLAHSVDLPPLAIPEVAASVTIDTFVELARARSGDLEVLRAFARAERSTEGALRVL